MLDRRVPHGCTGRLQRLAEEYDALARRRLGNFPQAFSHVAMVNSAMNLCECNKPLGSEQKPDWKAERNSMGLEMT